MESTASSSSNSRRPPLHHLHHPSKAIYTISPVILEDSLSPVQQIKNSTQPPKILKNFLLTVYLLSSNPSPHNSQIPLHHSIQSDVNAEILSDAPLANALPAFPWLVQPPQITPDSARTQKPWLEALAEGQGNLRDWNDEIQSTRSLPSTGVRERLIRERLLQKSLADFSACATYCCYACSTGRTSPT